MITDRTEADALLGNAKGVYGYADLNRVEEEVRRLDSFFPQLGLSPRLVTKTDWGLPGDFSTRTWPVRSQMERYLGNVKRLKGLFGVAIPLPDTMERLDVHGANAIEQVLVLSGGRLAGTLASFQYSGEVFAGEE